MKPLYATLIAVSMCLFLSPSCSRKSSPGKSCQIISLTDQNGSTPTGTTYDFTYNNAGQISTVKYIIGSVTYTRSFTYSGNTEIMTTTGGPAPITDSITLNSDSLVESDYYSEAYNRAVTTYTYSGAEVQTMITTANNGDAPDTNTYTWTNGDLTGADISGIGPTIYSYFSTPSEPGDYWSAIQLINYGGYYLKTAHQLYSIKVGPVIENINYSYDNTGKITLVSFTNGGSVETFSYKYACN